MLIELTGERKQQVNYSVQYNQDSKFKDKVLFGLILRNIAIGMMDNYSEFPSFPLHHYQGI